MDGETLEQEYLADLKTVIDKHRQRFLQHYKQRIVDYLKEQEDVFPVYKTFSSLSLNIYFQDYDLDVQIEESFTVYDDEGDTYSYNSLLLKDEDAYRESNNAALYALYQHVTDVIQNDHLDILFGGEIVVSLKETNQ